MAFRTLISGNALRLSGKKSLSGEPADQSKSKKKLSGKLPEQAEGTKSLMKRLTDETTRKMKTQQQVT